MRTGDDIIERLARRNPVDEAALADSAADSAARVTLERIAAEPFDAPPPARRPVRRVTGLAGAAALGALGVALFTHLPGGTDADAPAALPAGAWGMESTVRVTPVAGGVGLDEATARAARIIAARARAMGWKDVAVDKVAPGELRVTVPWAEFPWIAGGLTWSADLAVYDLATAVVGDSRRPAAAIAALRKGAPGGMWYGFTPPYSSLFFGTASAADIAKAPGWLRPVRAARGRRAFLVSRDTFADTTGRRSPAQPWVVVADPPAVAADAIGDVAVEGDTLRVTLTGHPSLARPILVSRESPYSIGSAVVRGGTLVVTPWMGSASVRAGSVAGGGLSASMAVTSTRSVGTPPARRGVRVARPAFARDRDAVAIVSSGGGVPPFGTLRPDTFLRVLTTRTPAGVWQIVEGLTTTGHRRVWLKTPGHTGTAFDCVLQPTARIVIGCGRTMTEAWGRVAPGVASVEVRYPDGVIRTGVVENGWFLVVGTRGEKAVIVARDSAGQEVGRTAR